MTFAAPPCSLLETAGRLQSTLLPSYTLENRIDAFSPPIVLQDLKRRITEKIPAP